MPYVKPDTILTQLVQAGANKANLAPKDLLIRGVADAGKEQTRLSAVADLIDPVRVIAYEPVGGGGASASGITLRCQGDRRIRLITPAAPAAPGATLPVSPLTSAEPRFVE